MEPFRCWNLTKIKKGITTFHLITTNIFVLLHSIITVEDREMEKKKITLQLVDFMIRFRNQLCQRIGIEVCMEFVHSLSQYRFTVNGIPVQRIFLK